MRALILFTVIVGALVALLWARPVLTPDGAAPRLAYVTTARQLGVVGYRDPIGVISPDGTRLAYTEGRHIRVVPVAGGVTQTLPAGDGQIRHLSWAGNDRLVGEDTTAATRWWSYQFGQDSVVRAPLWDGREVTAAGAATPVNNLRQLTWSGDAKTVAAFVTGKQGAELWRISSDGIVV